MQQRDEEEQKKRGQQLHTFHVYPYISMRSDGDWRLIYAIVQDPNDPGTLTFTRTIKCVHGLKPANETPAKASVKTKFSARLVAMTRTVDNMLIGAFRIVDGDINEGMQIYMPMWTKKEFHCSGYLEVKFEYPNVKVK